MILEERIKAFATLGNLLRSAYGQQLIEEWAYKANSLNNWFTLENTKNAINAIINGFLNEEKLIEWTGKYNIQEKKPLKIGVIMAGNIPLVGFHDALTVLLSNHILLAKLSSQDNILLKLMFEQLLIIEPLFQEKIQYVERLNDADRLIATGSDNSSRYFEYYFRQKPHIIRKNRTSVAVINGTESKESLTLLANDILDYFGLGCRNVSKLFVPENFKPDSFYEALEYKGDVMYNHKYKNNYDYNRSVLLVNGTEHFDNNFLMLKESKELVSPISVVFFEKYNDLTDLKEKLDAQKDKLQCIVSDNAWYSSSLAFGAAQLPGLSDYADGVDTMEFLTSV